jgi:REP element-mobilizing transposase RayT
MVQFRMPDYRRKYADGGTYFLTVRLKDRRSDVLVRKLAPRASWGVLKEELAG